MGAWGKEMKLRELYENVRKAGHGVRDVAIIFGRFNPPHQGHKAAWELASNFDAWYVGTNETTVGPKDPLPFNIKIAAMEAIWPEVKSHLVAEQNWWALAAHAYKIHGPVTLHIVTDANDARVFVPSLQKYNGVDGPHGFYHFKDIVWEEAPRISSATDLRAAVANNDPQAFEQAAGVPANTPIDGKPFFEVVKHYLAPYLHHAAEKEAEKAAKAKLKAEKEAAKAAKKKQLEVAEEFGVGKITAQNTTADVNASTPGKNLRAFKLAEQIRNLENQISQARNQVSENTSGAGYKTKGKMKPMDPTMKAAMKDASTIPGLNQAHGSAYTGWRFGLALAGAPTFPTEMEADSWLGGDPLLEPYTDVEFDMIKKAAQQVGAGTIQNWSGNRSKEVADVNKTSTVAKIKRNKYGI